jgi:hypothetical protein
MIIMMQSLAVFARHGIAEIARAPHTTWISANMLKHTGAEAEARKDAIAAGDALIRSRVSVPFFAHISRQHSYMNMFMNPV